MAKKKRRLKKKIKKFSLLLILIVFLINGGLVYNYYFVLNKELTPIEEHDDYYLASDFGINVIKSEYDHDNDGIDDYSDILLGAKKESEINPKYYSAYYAGGYPPTDEGVCTDTIWRALSEAGYNLKEMISFEIKHDQESGVNKYNVDIRDDNIDFRRVGPQKVFFDTYAESLTTDIYDIEEFMPGDILVFDGSDHIALVSDKRNANGIPYLIQNRDETQEEKEEDRLEISEMVVTSHYRFTYSKDLGRLINKLGV